MYLLTTKERVVRIPPERLGDDLTDVINQLSWESFEGKIEGSDSLTLMVSHVEPVVRIADPLQSFDTTLAFSQRLERKMPFHAICDPGGIIFPQSVHIADRAGLESNLISCHSKILSVFGDIVNRQTAEPEHEPRQAIAAPCASLACGLCSTFMFAT